MTTLERNPHRELAITSSALSSDFRPVPVFNPGPSIAAAVLLLCTLTGAATTTAAPPPGTPEEGSWPAAMTGRNGSHLIAGQETLIEIAPRSFLGYEALRKANPAIDPWLPNIGEEVLLPHFTIVPDEVAPGITINLPEYRLYFVREDAEGCHLRSYPVGIGSEKNPTPTGTFTVGTRIINPWWKVPQDLRKERRLPQVVPPGKDNPLGAYWLGISGRGIGIHGTNEPFGIGRLSSHGCIRLYPDDVKLLFPRVASGTRVQIINKPIKLGIKLNALFLEAHPRLYGQEGDALAEVLHQAEKLDWRWGVDWQEVAMILRETRGTPRVIAFRPEGVALATAPHSRSSYK